MAVHVPGGFARYDGWTHCSAPFLVPRADKDGNVISGLRLPEPKRAAGKPTVDVAVPQRELRPA